MGPAHHVSSPSLVFPCSLSATHASCSSVSCFILKVPFFHVCSVQPCFPCPVVVIHVSCVLYVLSLPSFCVFRSASPSVLCRILPHSCVTLPAFPCEFRFLGHPSLVYFYLYLHACSKAVYFEFTTPLGPFPACRSVLLELENSRVTR